MDATSTDDAYFIWRDDAQAGPYTLAQLRSMWHSGMPTRDAHYWHADLADWALLSSIKDRLELAAPPPATLPVANTSFFAAAWRYAVGISLFAVAFIAQEIHRSYSAPVRIAPETAGIIGGMMPVALYGGGLFVWYRHFKGHRGSVIGLLGALIAARDIGGLLARIIISVLRSKWRQYLSTRSQAMSGSFGQPLLRSAASFSIRTVAGAECSA